MCAAKLCQLRGCVGPVCLCVPAAAGAGLEPGANVAQESGAKTTRQPGAMAMLEAPGG